MTQMLPSAFRPVEDSDLVCFNGNEIGSETNQKQTEKQTSKQLVKQANKSKQEPVGPIHAKKKKFVQVEALKRTQKAIGGHPAGISNTSRRMT